MSTLLHLSETTSNPSPFGIVNWDHLSYGFYFDDTAKYLHGWPTHLTGYNWKFLFKRIYLQDRKIFIQKIRKIIQSDNSFNHECRIVLPNGEIRWLNYFGKIFRNSAGKIEYVKGTIIDTTEKKQQEQSLKDALAARDDLISIASHELKTPITSLKLQIQLAQRKLNALNHTPKTSEQLTNLLDVSIQQIDRLVDLIDELLDMAKIRAGQFDLQFTPTSLKKLNDVVIKRFLGEIELKQVNVKSSIADSIIGNWDESRIEQVLVNLLSNAIKYAPGKPILIYATQKQDWVSYYIQDQGPGIPEDQQKMIFQRFTRAKSAKKIRGLGLGLYIAKKIIESHKGKILVQSTFGYGATFIVKLPIDPLAITVNKNETPIYY